MWQFSIIVAQCQECPLQFNVSNRKVQDNGVKEMRCSSCLGHFNIRDPAQLNELLSTMDIPQMHEAMFSSVEKYNRKVGHEGVPAITVVCDDGWSKCTHKHTYNALGGVAVMIGSESKILLHIGIIKKNNVLYAQQQQIKINKSSTSQSIESDIILEGFLQEEKEHGVRYMRMIADGDSSVY
ncbi:LOW QUALITY PROTEIN: hypothetical protein MAR_034530 [Mya arenaria]|uniref:Mutator-like transposase domain-containing protein n=1 Tax=Mya arenaria TaxID=6604 RepID=A0ABY7GFH4_MYAAR|nr:LOW QUALITY PROTEIN: hypothetical protein MAR_034530 [Mya arenaria]